MTDPISDFLTHLRNASKAGLAQCVSPHSKLKESLANILKNEGFVRDVATGTDERGHKTVVVTMKYVDSAPVITGITKALITRWVVAAASRARPSAPLAAVTTS